MYPVEQSLSGTESINIEELREGQSEKHYFVFLFLTFDFVWKICYSFILQVFIQ